MYIILDAKDKDMQWTSSIVASRNNPSAGGGVVGLSTAKKLLVIFVSSRVLRRNSISSLEAIVIDGNIETRP